MSVEANQAATYPITNLDLSPDELREVLSQASETIVRYYTGLTASSSRQVGEPGDLLAMFDEPLPGASQNIPELLERVEREVFAYALPLVGPRFFTHIPSAGTHVGILGALLSSALNQNCALAEMGPSAAAIERQVIRWIAEFIGYPASTAGVLVSGGSMANLTCLAAARKAKAQTDVALEGMSSGPPLTVYISSEGHACHDKNMALLGLGKKHLRRIPSTQEFTMDLVKLEAKIKEDIEAGYKPICVIGNGGTAMTGTVDPLDALADLCAHYHLWFHVDAAYGGPAVGTELAQELFAGLGRADSIALDPHKWLFVPYEAGCSLVKDRELLRDTFSFRPNYAGAADSEGLPDFADYSPQLSREFKALKVWLTFKAYGAPRLRQAIQQNIADARAFGRMLDESEDFELMAPVSLSVVCFRYRTANTEHHHNETYLSCLNTKLLEAVKQDGRFFLTGTLVKGKAGLRVCCVNHRTSLQVLEELLALLRDLGSRVDEELKLMRG